MSGTSAECGVKVARYRPMYILPLQEIERMGKKRRGSQRPNSATARGREGNSSVAPKVTTKDDEFEKELRDFLELMKGLMLGLAMLGGAFIVMRSSTPAVLRVIGPWACAALGLSVGMASALIYARHRLSVKGQPLPIVIVRGFGLTTLLLMILGTFIVAGEINRQTPAPAKALPAPAALCPSKSGEELPQRAARILPYDHSGHLRQRGPLVGAGGRVRGTLFYRRRQREDSTSRARCPQLSSDSLLIARHQRST